MHRKQKIQLAASMLTIALMVVALMIPAAFAQDDMTMIPTDDFGKLQRPPVPFNHDEHNEKAGIDDCVVCHHSKTDDGKMDTENSSEGEACSECHAVKRSDGGTPLMRAFHRQCITCHEKQGKGPVACGQCHVKK